MKNRFAYVCAALALIFGSEACDTSYKQLTPPELILSLKGGTLSSTGGILRDSIKNFFKNQSLDGEIISIQASPDAVNLVNVRYTIESSDPSATGTLKLYETSETLMGEVGNFDYLKPVMLNFNPDKRAAVYTLNFFPRSETGAENSPTTLSLTVFDNLLPVAHLLVSKDETNSNPFAVILDGSQSVDLDAKYGGKVASYEFKVIDTKQNAHTIPWSSNPIIKQIFNEYGTYKVELRVADNDGAISPVVETYFEL